MFETPALALRFALHTLILVVAAAGAFACSSGESGGRGTFNPDASSNGGNDGGVLPNDAAESSAGDAGLDSDAAVGVSCRDAPCHSLATCSESSGTAICTCAAGYEGDGTTCADINECNGPHGCPVGTVCVNKGGSFECQCGAGYELKNGVCVDKCVIAKDRCDPISTCQIVANQAKCSCPSTHSDPNGNGSLCEANPTCLTTCTDPNSVCVVLGPTQVRCDCKVGFARPSAGALCADINECTLGTHGCSPNAACANSVGGFTCSCKSGYAGDGFVCNNINECSNGTHTCDPNAICTDASPGFTCACKPGYSGNGFSCTNINECATAMHDCDANAICTDLQPPARFSCACKLGYTGTGKTCTFQFCDLNGVWATRMQTATSWPNYQVFGQTIIQGGSFTANTWELRKLTYDGATLTHEVKPCGSTYPDSRNPFHNEVYGVYIPFGVSDGLPYQPAFSYALSSAAPDRPFTSPMRGDLYGIQMSDPLGAWPLRDAIAPSCTPGGPRPCWSNDDADLFPGATTWARPPNQVSAVHGVNYNYPPSGTQLVITRRAACQSMGLRSANRFNGKVVNCDLLGGSLVVGSIDKRLQSCHLAANSNNEVDCTTNKDKITGANLARCSAADEAELDLALDDLPITVTSANFVMARVTASATCPAVRATNYPTIP